MKHLNYGHLGRFFASCLLLTVLTATSQVSAQLRPMKQNAVQSLTTTIVSTPQGQQQHQIHLLLASGYHLNDQVDSSKRLSYQLHEETEQNSAKKKRYGLNDFTISPLNHQEQIVLKFPFTPKPNGTLTAYLCSKRLCTKFKKDIRFSTPDIRKTTSNSTPKP